jgi:small-conductance mechanosensitive channel
MSELLQNWKAAAWLVGLPVFMGLIGHFLAIKVIRKIVRRTGTIMDDSLVRHCYRPLQWLVVLIVIRLALPAALPGELPSSVSHILSLFFIATISWLLIRTAYVLEDYVVDRFEVGVKDNLRARKIHTQLRVLKRIVIIVAGVIGLSMILMTFPKVRQLGTTILASAGIIGIVVGMAAQRTIGAFIAGL